MSTQVAPPPRFDLQKRNNRTRISKMAAKRKKLTPAPGQSSKIVNGLYVHSSPPRAVVQMNPSIIRQWLRGGDIDKLQQVVLEGQGHKLVGEYSPDPKARAFLKTVPAMMANMETLQDLVAKGQLRGMQVILDNATAARTKKLVLCRDQSGVGLLHKAVFYDHQDIVRYLLDYNPATASLKDKEGRTPLHYCASCQDPQACWGLVEGAGADQTIVDTRGHVAAYYLDHPEELELPEVVHKFSGAPMKRFTSGKEGFVVTRANIRIWIHDRDLGRLQQMLWEGHGDKLRVETSNNPRVKRFLEAVPYIMGTIKEVHGATVRDDISTLMKKTDDPVPNTIFLSKDQNGLNPLHKAAGLGHTELVEYILEKNPKAANMTDNEGKLPLHYAAAVKDAGNIYNMLVEVGSDERTQDNRGKFPNYYKLKPGEADPQGHLKVVPDAPRTATVFPPAWDWRLLNNMVYDFGPIVPSEEGKRSGFVFGGEEVLSESDKSKTVDSALDSQSPESEPREMNHTSVGVSMSYVEHPDPTSKGVHVGEEEEDEGMGEEEVDKSDTGEQEKDEEPEQGAPPEDKDQVDRWERREDEETGKQDQQEVEESDNETVGEGEEGQDVSHEREDVAMGGHQHQETGEEKEDEAAAAEEETDTTEGDTKVADGEEEDAEVGGEEFAQGEAELDAEVRHFVETGNMEELAALVLNGQGERLVGHSSTDPELQSFLNNVPAYMAKIRAVHEAAKEGRLRDLQASLDRRKFAISRDNSSGLGATPLHVATLFGHTSIVRYLAGRFPETLYAKDNNDRTPLHYAATIRDNGHYYNLLLNMGANPTLKDNRGHTAEYYQQHPERLTHQKLLKDYGASEEIAEDSLSDKGEPKSIPDKLDTASQVELPVFWNEEGRYLAASLGEPLMKGLTEVANTRPKDPIAFLAAYLYNYANKNKSRSGTQESALLITSEQGDGERNMSVPLLAHTEGMDPLQPDEDTVPSPATPETAFSSADRDEHGQSMLHFAAARSHGRNALFQLLQETEINIGYRDELYRTARDVAIQANLPENIQEIDKWVVHLAARGETEKLVELLLEGYDHLIDVGDEEYNRVVDVATERNHMDTVAFLQSVGTFQERREMVHQAIRQGSLEQVTSMLTPEEGVGAGLLAVGKNLYGRCSLHVAVLCQNEDVVQFIANKFPETLRVGDNLERIALHYAMGVDKVETISNILIKAGAKRVLKDLKGRQPTYYFMNKSDILRLQDDEESFRE